MRRLQIVDCRFSIGAASIFVAALAFNLVVAPLTTDAQPATKIPRIGYLPPRARLDPLPYDRAFLQGMSEPRLRRGQECGHRVALCGRGVRAASGPCGGTGAAERRRHRRAVIIGDPCGTTGDHDHSNRLLIYGRPGRQRVCCEPGAALVATSPDSRIPSSGRQRQTLGIRRLRWHPSCPALRFLVTPAARLTPQFCRASRMPHYQGPACGYFLSRRALGRKSSAVSFG